MTLLGGRCQIRLLLGSDLVLGNFTRLIALVPVRLLPSCKQTNRPLGQTEVLNGSSGAD